MDRPVALLDVPVPKVNDCMTRMTADGARLRSMQASGRIAGLALTVKSRPGDNLALHKALVVGANPTTDC